MLAFCQSILTVSLKFKDAKIVSTSFIMSELAIIDQEVENLQVLIVSRSQEAFPQGFFFAYFAAFSHILIFFLDDLDMQQVWFMEFRDYSETLEKLSIYLFS